MHHRSYAGEMAGLIAFSLMAAGLVGTLDPAPPTASARTQAAASARASVRIMSGAKVTLSAAPQPEGYKLIAAEVTVEDGTRRQAQLVEFQ